MVDLYHCLGSLKAENDINLLQMFTETDNYAESVRPEYIFVVGRKGSGKSAIRCRLESDIKRRKEHSEVIGPTEFTFPGLEVLRQRSTRVPGFPFDDLLSTVWKFTILTTAMKHIVETPEIVKHAPDEDIRTIRNYLKVHNLGPKGARANFLSTCREVLRSIKGTPFDWVFTAADAIMTILDGSSYNNAIESMNRILDTGIKLYLFIDDIDRDWWKAKNADAVVRFMSALVNKLYEMFILRSDKDVRSKNLIVKAFLLTEGFGAVHTQSGSIIQEVTDNIRWTTDNLFRMICRRIGNATGHRRAKDLKWLWARLFPKTIPGEERLHLFAYLLRYTFHRPRDIIWICQECINQAANEGRLCVKDNKVQKVKDEMTKADVLAGIENFCAKCSWEVLREGRVLIPKLEEMCKIFSGWPPVMEKDFALQLIEEREDDLALDMDATTVIKQLFEVGFLGYVVPSSFKVETGKEEIFDQVFWYIAGEKTGLFEAARQVIIHSMFHKRFSIG